MSITKLLLTGSITHFSSVNCTLCKIYISHANHLSQPFCLQMSIWMEEFSFIFFILKLWNWHSKRLSWLRFYVYLVVTETSQVCLWGIEASARWSEWEDLPADQGETFWHYLLKYLSAEGICQIFNSNKTVVQCQITEVICCRWSIESSWGVKWCLSKKRRESQFRRRLV